MNKLNLDEIKIASCRKHAEGIAVDVQNFINLHSTVSVERTVLRLLGVDGVDDFGVPIPNKIVEDIDEIVRLVRFDGWQATSAGEREVSPR